MQKTLAQGGVIEQRHLARLHQGDFGINRRAALLQLGQPRLRVGLAAGADLLEQLKQRQQARFGADKGPLAQADQPGQGARGPGQVKMHLVGARRIKLAQPAALVGSPVVQIVLRTLGVGLLAETFTQAKQGVFEGFGQIGLGHYPHIGQDKGVVQKAANQGRVFSRQQAPCRMLAAQRFEGVVEANGWFQMDAMPAPGE